MSMTPPVEAPVPPPKRNNSSLIVVVVLGGVGVMCILLIAVGAAVLFPVFAQARRTASRTDALRRMRELSIGALMYSNDNGDRFPLAATWMDGLSKYVPMKRGFHSPGLNQRSPLDRPGYGIAFMKSLSGASVASIENPAQRVMIFDSTLMGPNAASGLETVPKPPRFGNADTGGNVFLFVDGHVKLVPAVGEVNLK
jgi:prepilin-type processing-associated H-X9-DG protein